MKNVRVKYYKRNQLNQEVWHVQIKKCTGIGKFEWVIHETYHSKEAAYFAKHCLENNK